MIIVYKFLLFLFAVLFQSISVFVLKLIFDQNYRVTRQLWNGFISFSSIYMYVYCVGGKGTFYTNMFNVDIRFLFCIWILKHLYQGSAAASENYTTFFLNMNPLLQIMQFDTTSSSRLNMPNVTISSRSCAALCSSGCWSLTSPIIINNKVVFHIIEKLNFNFCIFCQNKDNSLNEHRIVIIIQFTNLF